MSYELAWSDPAKDDLRQILDHISIDNPTAAVKLKKRIDHVVGLAQSLPFAFRQGRLKGTREVLATPTYLVIYRVHADLVEIAGIVHTSRDYPRTVLR